MSWQAQTAVNHHSAQRNMKLFRLLLLLAEGADETGLIDPAPNQSTLAEFFDVSDKTIRTWTRRLEGTGELTQVRVGSGAGNTSAYRINLPMPEKGGRKAEEDAGFSSAFDLQAMQEQIDFLAERVGMLWELQKAEERRKEGGKKAEERRKKGGSLPEIGGKFTGNRRKSSQCETSDDQYRSNIPNTKDERSVRWQLPKALETEDFIRAWYSWLEYADQRDLPMPEARAAQVLAHLADVGPETAVKAIALSIQRGWKNVITEPVIEQEQAAQNGRYANGQYKVPMGDVAAYTNAADPGGL